MVEEKRKCEVLIRDCSLLAESMLVKNNMAIAIKDGRILDIMPEPEADKYEANETVKEQAEEIEKKILLEYEFYESEEIAKMKKSRGGNGSPKRILEPFNTFLMEESDFNRYLDLAYSNMSSSRYWV